MPKIISESIRQEVRSLIASAYVGGEKLSLDRLYRELGARRGREPGLSRTTFAKLLKQAREEIKHMPAPDPPWDPSPMNVT